MRIAKATLTSRWAWSSGLALLVFGALWALDLKLKALSGVGTLDLAGLSGGPQLRAAFWAWSTPPLAARAGFDLGLSFLLMPLYAASFFYSGIIAAEGFAPRPSQLRRVILMAALAPLIGAGFDAIAAGLNLTMLVNGPSDMLATLTAAAQRVRTVALLIGLALFLGAVMARFQQRRAAGGRGAGRVGFGENP